MASKAQLTGMRGVFLVAAQLSKRGFIVSPTSRSALGADLLVTDQECCKTFSVQVKTNAKSASFWLIGAKAKTAISRTHIYVLVNLRDHQVKGDSVDYYIVPSKDLAKLGYHDGNWPNIQRAIVAKYKDNWSPFGSPGEQL
jgi:hypothetical protein